MKRYGMSWRKMPKTSPLSGRGAREPNLPFEVAEDLRRRGRPGLIQCALSRWRDLLTDKAAGISSERRMRPSACRRE
jgi:hypothetical protein